LGACAHLINQLPDCVIDWARDGIGNANAAAIVHARNEARDALALAREEEEVL